MRLLTFAIAAVLAMPLAAATRYTVTVGSQKATVLADGAHRRVDVPRQSPPFEFDVLLSDDGGATFTAIRPIDLTTSYPEVDTQLLPALAKVHGFPIKTVLTATCAYVGVPAK
jgi:hypothetical protein